MSREPEWTDFVEVQPIPRIYTNEELAILGAEFQMTAEQLAVHLNRIQEEGCKQQWFENSRYLVAKRVIGELVVHLSIRRQDREPIHDWRELQRIKNELVGPEHEAVELYPAESRVVDTSNQFHLWVLADGEHFPLGWETKRHVTGEDVAFRLGAKQRAHEGGN